MSQSPIPPEPALEGHKLYRVRPNRPSAVVILRAMQELNSPIRLVSDNLPAQGNVAIAPSPFDRAEAGLGSALTKPPCGRRGRFAGIGRRFERSAARQDFCTDLTQAARPDFRIRDGLPDNLHGDENERGFRLFC